MRCAAHPGEQMQKTVGRNYCVLSSPSFKGFSFCVRLGEDGGRDVWNGD